MIKGTITNILKVFTIKLLRNILERIGLHGWCWKCDSSGTQPT